jgi:predicted permease
VSISDLRFALRSWRRNPGTAAAAVLSLTLGIGANAVIFTFVKELFLPRLPVDDASRVVMIYSTTVSRSGELSQFQTTSFPNARDVQQRSDAFAGVSIVVDTEVDAQVDGTRAPALAHLVSGNYFSLLGVSASAGRVLTASDESDAGATPPVVISRAFWRTRFAASPSAIGAPLQLNNRSFVVVGVAAEPFHDVGALGSADLWVPLSAHEELLRGNLAEWFMLRAARVCTMVARLKPGTSRAAAQAALDGLGAALAEEFPSENHGRSFMAVPLVQTMVPPPQWRTYVRAGSLLIAIVAVVLLIACANVANLLLGRAIERRREFGVRLALGASRQRLVVQLLVEGLMLSAVAGSLALVFAVWARSALLRLIPAGLQPNLDFAIDRRVLAFTLGVSLVATLVFALAPALRVSRIDAAAMLDIAGHPAGRRHFTGVRGIVVAQTALSYLAVVVALLFVRSLLNLRSADPGFEIGREVVVSLDFASRGYDEPRAQQALVQVLDRLRVQPSLESASAADSAPLRGGFRRTTFPDGVDTADPANGRLNTTFNVAPGFFHAAGLRLERGRDFTEHDDGAAPYVAVINDTAARAMWPGADPIGRRMKFLLQTWEVTVVGIVNTATVSAMGEPPQPVVYFPLQQHFARRLTLYVKARGDAAAAAADVVAAIRAIDPDLRPERLRAGEQIVDDSLAARRAGTRLLLVAGALALFLSALGVYSVAAYSVSLRTREMAIRGALGATRLRIVCMIIAQATAPVAAGLAAGAVAAGFVARAVAALTFGVGGVDPVAFVGAALLMLSIPAGAALVAATRSARLELMQALRVE